jgi:hypothetical protein
LPVIGARPCHISPENLSFLQTLGHAGSAHSGDHGSFITAQSVTALSANCIESAVITPYYVHFVQRGPIMASSSVQVVQIRGKWPWTHVIVLPRHLHWVLTPMSRGANSSQPGLAKSNIELRCGELFHTLKAPHGLSMHGQALPSCCHLEADMPS